MAHIIEGTRDEIKAHEAEFDGHRLRLIIDPEEPQDRSAAWSPADPITIRDREHLVHVLAEALASPGHPVTKDTWETRHRMLEERFSDSK